MICVRDMLIGLISAVQAFVAVGGSMGIVWSNDGGTKWTVTNTPMTGTADLKVRRAMHCIRALACAPH